MEPKTRAGRTAALAGAAQTRCSGGMCWCRSQARGCSQLAGSCLPDWLSAGPCLRLHGGGQVNPLCTKKGRGWLQPAA